MAKRESAPRRVALLGSGVIGLSWGVSLLRAGFEVSVHKRDPRSFDDVRAGIDVALNQLIAAGMLDDDARENCMERLQLTADIEEAVSGSVFVQESLPEDRDLKVDILSQVLAASPETTPVGSSTSTIMPSEFTRDLPQRERCFVGHPLNPPHLIPAVEVVPAPWTDPDILETALGIYREAGHRPLVLDREIEGFVMSRLQSALLHEAFRLLEDGVAGADAIDHAVSSGLGLRWAILGPLEAVALNVPRRNSGLCGRIWRCTSAHGRGNGPCRRLGPGGDRRPRQRTGHGSLQGRAGASPEVARRPADRSGASLFRRDVRRAVAKRRLADKPFDLEE